MMKDIKKEIRLSLSKRTNKSINGFVHYKTSSLESFKNNRIYDIVKKIPPKLQNLKRFFKSILEKPRLWASFIDWEEAIRLSSLWILEAFVEGILANWSTHKIFGLEFGIGMIFAHGFLIKQGLNLYHRTKKHGEPTTIPTKK